MPSGRSLSAAARARNRNRAGRGDSKLSSETTELHLGGPAVATVEYWSWRLRAACRHAERELFFSPDGERGIAKRRRERAAKAVCVTCPVREECAAYAIANREPHGVWGGLSEREREHIWSCADTLGDRG